MAHPLRQLVAMSTVGLLFVGGVAAAATGSNPLSPLLSANEDAGPLVTAHVTTTITTIDSTTTTTLAKSTSALATDAICAAAANHGEAVSEVAKETSAVGAQHGAVVSEMARSDCGKTEAEESAEIEAPSEPAPDETLAEMCASAANHGEAVSNVAKDKATVGAEHGAAVSAMAKSDCGKPDASKDDEDDDKEREAPGASSKSTKSHGRLRDSDEASQGS